MFFRPKMKSSRITRLKEYSIFFWLILITLFGVIISTIYKNSEIEKSHKIKSSLSNIYLKKTLKEITNNLEPRYTTKKYISQTGDTYEIIINKLDVSKEEKKLLLKSILKEKTLKILRVNQMFEFKFDNLYSKKVMQEIGRIKNRGKGFSNGIWVSVPSFISSTLKSRNSISTSRVDWHIFYIDIQITGQLVWTQYNFF